MSWCCYLFDWSISLRYSSISPLFFELLYGRSVGAGNEIRGFLFFWFVFSYLAYHVFVFDAVNLLYSLQS